MWRGKFTAYLKKLNMMINRTKDALGKEQTDSQQYVLFSRHLHSCVGGNIDETFW